MNSYVCKIQFLNIYLQLELVTTGKRYIERYKSADDFNFSFQSLNGSTFGIEFSAGPWRGGGGQGGGQSSSVSIRSPVESRRFWGRKQTILWAKADDSTKADDSYNM